MGKKIICKDLAQVINFFNSVIIQVLRQNPYRNDSRLKLKPETRYVPLEVRIDSTKVAKMSEIRQIIDLKQRISTTQTGFPVEHQKIIFSGK